MDGEQRAVFSRIVAAMKNNRYICGMTAEERTIQRVLDCRVYNGEDSCPEGKNDLLWGYERHWVYHTDTDRTEEIEDMHRLGLDGFMNEDDGTPLSLKALLFNRYAHWVGSAEGGDGFVRWYADFYLSAGLTNRQLRYERRKSELVRRCRYYKGEDICPDSNPKAQHFWTYERIWVDALSKSYRNAEKWRKVLERYPRIYNFVAASGLPASLVGLLISSDGRCSATVNEEEFIKELKSYYL